MLDIPDTIPDDAQVVYLGLLAFVVANTASLVDIFDASADGIPAGGILYLVGMAALTVALFRPSGSSLREHIWALTLISAGGTVTVFEGVGAIAIDANSIPVIVALGLLGTFAVFAQPLANYRDDLLDVGGEDSGVIEHE